MNGRRPDECLDPEVAAERGYLELCGPYRAETEDWMLRRALADQLRAGMTVVLVWQRARADQGGYMGIAIWRRRGAGR